MITLTPEELLDRLKYNITTDKTGATFYWVNGEVHRDEDQPAVIFADGTKWWFQNGRLHRDNDLPATINADGTNGWWVNGEFIKSEQS